MLQHSLIAMAYRNWPDSSPRGRALYPVRFARSGVGWYVVVHNVRLFVTWGPRLCVPRNILRLLPRNSREFPYPLARRELSHSDYKFQPLEHRYDGAYVITMPRHFCPMRRDFTTPALASFLPLHRLGSQWLKSYS